MKKPRRVFSDQRDPFWWSEIRKHGARVLRNGESPVDFPHDAVAFETQNFGWILSKPEPKRRVLLKY